MVVTRDGRHAFIGCNDGLIRKWNLVSGTEEGRFKDHTSCIYDVDLSRDEKLLVSGGKDNIVRIWDAATGQLISRCEGHTNSIQEVAFFPSSRFVASIAHDGTIRVWETSSGREIRQFTQSDDVVLDVKALAISPDGRWLVSGGCQADIKVWDVQGNRLVSGFRIHEQQVKQKDGNTIHTCVALNGIRFGATSDRVISVGEDGKMRIWDRLSGRVLHEYSVDKNTWRFTLSEDGRRAVVSGRGEVQVWSLPAGR